MSRFSRRQGIAMGALGLSAFLTWYGSTAASQAADAPATLPEFQGIDGWLNSDPLTAAELKGQVVAVQFWTLGCINCIRTLPHVTQLDRTYRDQGLVVVGVHTPEFPYERDIDAVKAAIEKHGIAYAVAIDNQFRTWQAYSNQYWPHIFLADRQGRIRFDHIGEGAYDRIDQTVQNLLSKS
jgi:thiol-disulfide isomerase/thioredoxin